MILNIFGRKVRIDESLLHAVKKQIQQDINLYLRGRLKNFNYTIKYEKISDPLRILMKALVRIPYGETKTYGEIGKMINLHPRKVGILCAKNPLPIVVPCHRVVGKHDIGGYSYGKELKIKLLELERSSQQSCFI
jgi:methylated-DNA-[protein]-cysteine S-methyltransferase